MEQAVKIAAAPDKRPLRQCLPRWAYEERALLARLAFAAVVSILLALAAPRVSQIVFDTALPNGSPRLMLVAAVAVFVVGAHMAWISWLQGVMSIDFGAALERSAMLRAVNALVYTTADQRKQWNPGWMMTTVSGAGTAAQRFGGSVTAVIAQALACVGYLVSLAGYSVAATGLVILLNLGLALLGMSLIKFEENHVRRALDSSSAQQQYLHMLLSRLASLRGLFATERLASRWSFQVQQTAEAQLASGRVGIVMSTVDSVGGRLLSQGITLWATYQCFERTITLGEMMFLLTSAAGLSATLTGLVHGFLGFRGLGPYLGRVDEIVGAARVPVESEESGDAPLMLDDRIRVDKVSFRYGPQERWILQNHDWVVKRGDVIHLRSPSGSGKSTLLRLIAGLLKPSTGSITVFGLSPEDARKQVLYVPQSCDLFETSIRENLELFSGATRDEILRVSALTGLAQMLQKLPMGEETRIAAQGQNLSSGQRQLIILTAAFASSRPVLLLDESTGQIDAHTRSLCRWDELTRGRTVIRVEHA
jgi:ABC-type bacteriocin/lantibiotic exporter with double-glycine peptidase domain